MATPVYFTGELAPITQGMIASQAEQNRRAAANDSFLANLAKGRMEYDLGRRDDNYRNRALDEDMRMRRLQLDEYIRQFDRNQQYMRDNMSEMSTLERERLAAHQTALNAQIQGLKEQTDIQGRYQVEATKAGRSVDPGVSRMIIERNINDEEDYQNALSKVNVINQQIRSRAILKYSDGVWYTESGAVDQLNSGVYSPRMERALADAHAEVILGYFGAPGTDTASRYLDTDPKTYKVSVNPAKDPNKNRLRLNTEPNATPGITPLPPTETPIGTNKTPEIEVRSGTHGWDTENRKVTPSAAVSTPLESGRMPVGNYEANPGGDGFFERYMPFLTTNPFMPSAQAEEASLIPPPRSSIPTNGVSGWVQDQFRSPRPMDVRRPAPTTGFRTQTPLTRDDFYNGTNDPLRFDPTDRTYTNAPYQSTPQESAYFDQFEKNVRRNEAYERQIPIRQPASVAVVRQDTSPPSGLLGPTFFDQPYSPWPPSVDIPLGSPPTLYAPAAAPIPSTAAPMLPSPRIVGGYDPRDPRTAPTAEIPLPEPYVLPQRPTVVGGYDPRDPRTAPTTAIPLPPPYVFPQRRTGDGRSALGTAPIESPRGAANRSSWGRRMAR